MEQWDPSAHLPLSLTESPRPCCPRPMLRGICVSNCSHGPFRMIYTVSCFTNTGPIPSSTKPNAILPLSLVRSKPVLSWDPKQYLLTKQNNQGIKTKRMCSSTKTSQGYTWLARKWPVLYSRFSLESHLTELLISKIHRHLFCTPVSRTVQQCLCSCSIWPHLQSLIHSFIHSTIYHMCEH